MKTITVVDTFGFFFRSFFALPPLKNKKGFPTGLLLGFCNLLNSLYKSGNCDYIIFALEGGGINRRKLLDPRYKQNRQEAPKDLLLQLPIAVEWIKKMGFINLSIEGYEADDIIASVSTLAHKKNLDVYIISHDKDLYQLIDSQTFIYDPIKKINIREAQCQEKFGVFPNEFIDYQSLVGDSSDNVMGIKGIGPKTACKLIKYFGDLDSMYARSDELENVISPRLSKIVRDCKEDALLSRKLITLVKDIPIDIDFSTCAMPEENPLLKIVDELHEYDFNGILTKIQGPKYQDFISKKSAIRVQQETQKLRENFIYEWEIIDSQEKLFGILNTLKEGQVLGFDTESSGLDTKEAYIVGFSFCLDSKKGYYVPIGHTYLGVGAQISKQEAKIALQKIFSYKLVGHNLKFDISLIWQNFGIKPENEIIDTMVLAWLFDSAKPVGLDKQMLRWFDYKMVSFDEIVDKKQTFADIDLEIAAQYAVEDAVATFSLYERLFLEFKNRNLEYILELAKSLEFPFINVLVQMEMEGIKIDTLLFERLNTDLTKILTTLTHKIYDYAGENFNINSPQQLSHILFNKVGLQSGRSVKGGLSTDEQTLNNIIDTHPIIQLILEYREMSKLKNTYIEPLLKYAKQNGEHKVYTSFLQTGTVTGRLSSKAPNLQNIPVRSEYGRKVREGFIAQENCKLISVDYSQIELRLLAHFSEDSRLLEAFRLDKDIHYETALRLFGENLAVEKRFIAKTINFGLIYGMGAKKLGETLKIPFKEAKAYIESYFELFPTVKNYLGEQKELLLKNGYTQTLLGRRRYFDFQNATEFMKANYLREGINCIFQGSAADLIKLCMYEIYKKYQCTELKMLLQVHDELIFQAPDSKVASFIPDLEILMNSIYTLKVPLKCSVNIGKSWADLK
ncbi:MAG: DNA polymerase I [Helicobacter sp.]|nr:DNA polymerase I [Helicobacter sp.]MDD7567417.1 DNA polymerase I [Helicobacter sp.]MDY5740518.1 DNA polymerase I [Helicobacter sp.]